MPKIVLQHKISKRFLVKILPKNVIETTTQPLDAISWDLTSKDRQQKLRAYMKRYSEFLLQNEFEQVVI